jgi:hypothetical protein
LPSALVTRYIYTREVPSSLRVRRSSLLAHEAASASLHFFCARESPFFSFIYFACAQFHFTCDGAFLIIRCTCRQ